MNPSNSERDPVEELAQELVERYSRGERPSLKGHTLSFSSVVFSPDGKTLASVGSDNLIKLWDTAGRR
jgi:WD40 repeat protein